jgi:hypothetical protein
MTSTLVEVANAVVVSLVRLLVATGSFVRALFKRPAKHSP